MNGKVLVVEDIVDTGASIDNFMSLDNATVASLFINVENCEIYPHIEGERTVDWIVFPWEIGTDDALSTVNYGGWRR
jgi:hypoxanthine phosphoribosyltransferase